MLYGGAGAIATRTITGLVSGFIPSALSSSQFADPLLQAAIAATAVRWAGTKFLGKPQGDTMMLGGLISAALSAADKFLPNIQGTLTGIIRAPIATAPQAAIAANGMADVEDVDMVAAGFGGFGDVEDVDTGLFNNY